MCNTLLSMRIIGGCPGIHGLACKQAPSRIIRHHALNDVVARASQSTGTPFTKEPVGLTRLDGKRPDGLTLIPWHGGKPLTWDVTVVSTLAASYLSSSAWSACAAADLAASRKEAKYTSLTNSYIFSAHRSRIPRCVQFKCPLLPLHFGRTLDWYLRRLARNVISIPKTIGHCTEFQFGLNTRELCFRAPHRLKDIFTFCNCNDMLAMLSRGQ